MNGIVIIAFGKEYDRTAAYCCRESRKHTLLPFHVLTNLLAEQRSSIWNEIEDVTCEYIEVPDNDNRFYKLQMNEFSPFEKTLYLDADAVIQRKGIEVVFSMLEHADFVLNSIYNWKPGDKIPNIYAKALLAMGGKLPLRTYSGGFFAWRKGQGSDGLFRLWNDYFQRTGQGRDMPALACAVQRIQPRLFDVGSSPFFASQSRRPECIIQHNDNDRFFEDFGIPWFQENKWFDSDPTDFHMTDFKRIVTIKSFNGIGDLLFVTPTFEVIKKAYPDCRLVVNTNLPTLLANNPYIDEVGTKNEGVFLGYTAPDSGRLPTEHHILEDWRIVCDEYHLITAPPTLRPQLYLKDLPAKRDVIGVQVIHKGNYHNKRVWPGLNELSRRLGFEPIPQITEGDKAVGLARKIAEYSVVVCPEGGISHLAAALNVPVVVVFGGFSDPAWTGYADHVNIVSGIECRHCYNNNPCANKEPFKCFQSICVESVEEAALALTKKNA